MRNDRRIAAKLNRITIKRPMSANAYRMEAHAIFRRYNKHDSNFYHLIVELVDISIPHMNGEARKELGRMIRRCEEAVQEPGLNVVRNRARASKKEYKNNYTE